MNLRCVRLAALVSVVSIVCGQSTMAGPIDPPTGPVGPTMKTLDEVEPRIPINTTNTPGQDDARFAITEPGSYYLTQNELIVGRPDFGTGGFFPADGILVLADDVTIDLNGFSLQGGSGARIGIRNDPNANTSGLKITNGTVTNFEETGILIVGRETEEDPSEGDALIADIHVRNNGGNGVFASNTIVERCRATGNGITGINASIVLSSFAVQNDVDGFRCSIARDCVAFGNRNWGFNVNGLLVERCVSNNNLGGGFTIGRGTITNCRANGNVLTGFSINNAIVRACVSTDNDLGFQARGGATIKDCHSNGNEIGFEANASGNVFAGNIARDNTTNWDIVEGNVCYVVRRPNGAAINGDSGGTDFQFSPMTNFTQ